MLEKFFQEFPAQPAATKPLVVLKYLAPNRFFAAYRAHKRFHSSQIIKEFSQVPLDPSLDQLLEELLKTPFKDMAPLLNELKPFIDTERSESYNIPGSPLIEIDGSDDSEYTKNIKQYAHSGVYLVNMPTLDNRTVSLALSDKICAKADPTYNLARHKNKNTTRYQHAALVTATGPYAIITGNKFHAYTSEKQDAPTPITRLAKNPLPGKNVPLKTVKTVEQAQADVVTNKNLYNGFMRISVYSDD